MKTKPRALGDVLSGCAVAYRNPGDPHIHVGLFLDGELFLANLTSQTFDRIAGIIYKRATGRRLEHRTLREYRHEIQRERPRPLLTPRQLAGMRMLVRGRRGRLSLAVAVVELSELLIARVDSDD